MTVTELISLLQTLPGDLHVTRGDTDLHAVAVTVARVETCHTDTVGEGAGRYWGRCWYGDACHCQDGDANEERRQVLILA